MKKYFVIKIFDIEINDIQSRLTNIYANEYKINSIALYKKLNENALGKRYRNFCELF